MKKLNKYLLLAVSAITALANISMVSAATLTYDETNYNWERRDSEHHASAPLKFYKVDGKVAYCIEPRVHEGTNNYTEGSWDAANLDDDIKDEILTITYYGYTYPGHNTIKYYAATQAMLWETIMGDGSWVKITTELWGKGKELDISAERAEIKRLVANHTKKPSFNGNTYETIVGDTIHLHDNNNVLSDYRINVENAKYTINENDLAITPTSNDVKVSFIKNLTYDSNYKIFYGDGIQNLIVYGNTDPVYADVKVNAYYGGVEMYKQDRETTTAQGQASLASAIYGVYKNNGTLVTKLTTDEKGYAKSGEILERGDYYLQELVPSKGYKLDQTKYSFSVNGKVPVKMYVKEDIIENSISILKQYGDVNGETTFLNAEPNVTFEIYYANGKKYKEITTDKNGYASTKLPYGIWKFHQVNSTTGYAKIYDFNIIVDESSEENQHYNILNNSFPTYVKVVKVDSETKKVIALANTTFKILNTDTNQIVTQYVGGKVYDEFSTDETGTFTTYLKIPSGNYKLIEVKAPNGYVINKNGLFFSIGENTDFHYTNYGPVIELKYENKPIKGQIEIIKKGEKVILEKNSFSYGEDYLKDVIFKIYANDDVVSSDGKTLYYEKGELVDTIITDKNGYATSKKLPLGKYYVIEDKTSSEYVLDVSKHEISLEKVDDSVELVYETLNLKNVLKKSKLEFTKTDLTTGEVIPNTKVEIYYASDKGDKLIYSGITDKNGKIIIDGLFVGDFYIVEIEPSTGYKINEEKEYFTVKENRQIIKANMTNEKIKSTLEFTKVDLSTGESLPNTKIQIFNEKDELVFEGTTDENGKIIVENIEYGKYYILESEAPEGYSINSERMYFEVKEDGEVIKSTMSDEKVIIDVPITESNDYMCTVGLLFIILGTGSAIYVISKRKKN